MEIFLIVRTIPHEIHIIATAGVMDRGSFAYDDPGSEEKMKEGREEKKRGGSEFRNQGRVKKTSARIEMASFLPQDTRELGAIGTRARR